MDQCGTSAPTWWMPLKAKAKNAMTAMTIQKIGA